MQDNEHLDVAVKNLPVGEKITYNTFIKDLYGHLNFQGKNTVNNGEPIEEETIAFVVRQLNDGIHPSVMEESEIAVLVKELGDEWYKKWGYVKGDLTEIVTLDREIIVFTHHS